MITFSRLSYAGRLGNQLWEIASTFGIGESYGEPVIFPNWDYQPYFSIPRAYFGDTYGHKDAVDYAIHIDARTRVYLQDLKLWSFISDKIRKFFRPSPLAKELLADHPFWQISGPKTSLHVRRGDNAYRPDPDRWYPLPTLDYYEKALQIIDKPENSIVVFSDDIEWCRKELPVILGDNAYYFGGHTRPPDGEGHDRYIAAPPLDWDDLFLMADPSCVNHILSNSTYSWWGAWLSGDQRAIYPLRWFGTELSWIHDEWMHPSCWIGL